MEKETLIYKFIHFGGDIYDQIYRETGLDIRNDPNYRISSVGAEDNMGISETLYSEIYVWKKNKIKENPPVPVPVPVPIGTGGGYDDSTDTTIIFDAIQECINKEENESPKMVRGTKKYINSAGKWLGTLALITLLLNSFANSITPTSLGYTVKLDSGAKYEISNESLQQIVGTLEIGSNIMLNTGDELYNDSRLNDPKVVIGEGIRKEGIYQISGVSIVLGDEIIDYTVDLNIENPGLKIKDFVNEVCNKYNLDVNNINIRLHIGNSSNETRTGWIDATKLFTLEHIDQGTINQFIDQSATYMDSIEDFKGSTITFATHNGDVTINVKDEFGEFYKSGTSVIGSDGNSYVIEELSIQNEELSDAKSNGGKLKFTIKDSALAICLISATTALATSIATNKKNEEEQNNPKFFEFEDDLEYQKFKEDFENRKKDYEGKSGFKRMMKDLFWRREVGLLQNLTSEQIELIYSTIKNCHTADYSYSETDKIEFKNGKILVTSSDNKVMDITNVVLPSIANIGKENEVIAEGLFAEEEELEENGIYRR